MASKQVAQTVLADRLGITTRRIRDLVQEEVLTEHRKGGRPSYPWPQVRKEYSEYKDRCAQEKYSTSDEVKRERAGLIRAQRKLAELDLAKKTGLQVDVDIAADEVKRITSFLRARLLNLPGRLGPMMVGLKTVPKAVERLDSAVYEMMQEIASGADELKHDRKPTSCKRAAKKKRATRKKKPRATTKAQRKRVG